jgi:transposase
VKELRGAFALAAAALRTKTLVFLDEFGANLGMVPSYGRAPRGKRVHIDKPCYRSKNVTFAGAMTQDGVLTIDALPGPANIVNFVLWVRDCLAPFLRPGHVVIMDNLRAHRNEEAVAAITATGASVLFMPPYSPDLNPIEACWSKIKAFLRKARARTQSALLLAVDIATAMVSAADAHGWLTHAGYRVSDHQHA